MVILVEFHLFDSKVSKIIQKLNFHYLFKALKVVDENGKLVIRYLAEGKQQEI